MKINLNGCIGERSCITTLSKGYIWKFVYPYFYDTNISKILPYIIIKLRCQGVSPLAEWNAASFLK